MFLTVDYYLKKNHIFKQRNKKKIYNNKKIKVNTFFIKSLKNQRFESVYLRIFKKFLRKSYCKTKMRFFKPKFWVKIFINGLLTKKSKNARMGAGVGAYHRAIVKLYEGMIILQLKFFFLQSTIKILRFISFKTKLSLKLYK